MGCDSNLFFKNGINVIALTNYINTIYDKCEVFTSEFLTPCYSILMSNKDNYRRLWLYTYRSQDDGETPVPVIDNVSCSISISYLDDSVKILENIAKNFGGGYIQENDCGHEYGTDKWYYVEGDNSNTSFITDKEAKIFSMVTNANPEGLDPIKLTQFIKNHLDEIKNI